MEILKLVALWLLSYPVQSSVLFEKACNPDGCFMNLAGSSPGPNSVTSDCSSFFQIVPVTQNVASTTTSTTRTITISRGDVLGFVLGLLGPDESSTTTESPTAVMVANADPAIPTYASNCDEKRYSSACSCLGLSPSRTTTVYGVTTYTLYTTTWIYKTSLISNSSSLASVYNSTESKTITSFSTATDNPITSTLETNSTITSTKVSFASELPSSISFPIFSNTTSLEISTTMTTASSDSSTSMSFNFNSTSLGFNLSSASTTYISGLTSISSSEPPKSTVSSNSSMTLPSSLNTSSATPISTLYGSFTSVSNETVTSSIFNSTVASSTATSTVKEPSSTISSISQQYPSWSGSAPIANSSSMSHSLSASFTSSSSSSAISNSSSNVASLSTSSIYYTSSSNGSSSSLTSSQQSSSILTSTTTSALSSIKSTSKTATATPVSSRSSSASATWPSISTSPSKSQPWTRPHYSWQEVCRYHPHWCKRSSFSTFYDGYPPTLSSPTEQTSTEEPDSYPTEYLPEPYDSSTIENNPSTTETSAPDPPESTCYANKQSDAYYPEIPESYDSCEVDPDDPSSKIQLRDPSSGRRIGGDGTYAKIVSEDYNGFYSFSQPKNAPCGVYDLILHTPDDHRYVAITPNGEVRFRWKSSDGQGRWKSTDEEYVTTIWSVRCDGSLQTGIIGGKRFSFVLDVDTGLIRVIEEESVSMF